MARIIKFRRSRQQALPFPLLLAITVLVGGGIGIFIPLRGGTAEPMSVSFSMCHAGGGTNCVVDGDTIWLQGVKIRIADIDAPETHPSRCAREADLGNRATQRLHDLLNAGSFTVERYGSRDTDKYGRELRVVKRNGRSLGQILVEEGLARAWDGARHPWC